MFRSIGYTLGGVLLAAVVFAFPAILLFWVDEDALNPADRLGEEEAEAPVELALTPLEAGALANAAQLNAGFGPGLGVAATAEQVARVNISIPPDGRNLPPGQGNVADGAAIFAATCVECHGEAGAGGQGLVRLTGGVGSLRAAQPVKTVSSFWPYATTLFDYIRRAMPLTAPQSLTDEQVYAVTAYILSIDAIVPPDAVLDATTLPQVVMPNREGFENWWPTQGAPLPGAAAAAGI